MSNRVPHLIAFRTHRAIAIMSSYSGYVTVRINVKNVLIDAFLLLQKTWIQIDISSKQS